MDRDRIDSLTTSIKEQINLGISHLPNFIDARKRKKDKKKKKKRPPL